MAQIAVDQVQAGMVLAAEVQDRRGRLLIPSGRELDSKHVQALKMWGITRVEIQGDDPAAEGAQLVSPEMLEAARAILDDRLRNLDPKGSFRGILTEAILPRVASELAGRQAHVR